jgi:hypothetical protein
MRAIGLSAIDRPFTGLMTISDAPLRHTLAPL